MMPAHPHPTSTLHATLLADPTSDYQPDAWQTCAGAWHGWVGLDAGPLWFTIQGPPAGLRALAVALAAAADAADQHTADPQAAREGVLA
jgi:hypothetical protein